MTRWRSSEDLVAQWQEAYERMRFAEVQACYRSPQSAGLPFLWQELVYEGGGNYVPGVSTFQSPPTGLGYIGDGPPMVSIDGRNLVHFRGWFNVDDNGFDFTLPGGFAPEATEVRPTGKDDSYIEFWPDHRVYISGGSQQLTGIHYFAAAG
jgi:hypothetical protein